MGSTDGLINNSMSDTAFIVNPMDLPMWLFPPPPSPSPFYTPTRLPAQTVNVIKKFNFEYLISILYP